MNFEEYQMKANLTRLSTSSDIYCFLNLAAEVGEVLSLEAKLIRDGGNIEKYRENLKKELGDVLWHIAAIASDHGFDLADIAQVNIDKLTSRLARNKIKGSGDER
jgi:NTP pyrophosphatase (non-canonical NTP hydrolase)